MHLITWPISFIRLLLLFYWLFLRWRLLSGFISLMIAGLGWYIRLILPLLYLISAASRLKLTNRPFCFFGIWRSYPVGSLNSRTINGYCIILNGDPSGFYIILYFIHRNIPVNNPTNFSRPGSSNVGALIFSKSIP